MGIWEALEITGIGSAIVCAFGALLLGIEHLTRTRRGPDVPRVSGRHRG